MKGKTAFAVLVIVCAALCGGCSTRKNTSATRAYHELTTRYNVFFNAQELYNSTLKSQSENYADNFLELLPLYPANRISGKTQPGGAFDPVIEKTEKAIREHSISAKPRRDPSQPLTQEYREWLRQEEFNPFIKNAWLLLGKAHVQNGDYEQALTVFEQTLKLFANEPDVISETQIWMMRTYTELEWFWDAENMAYILQVRNLPKELDNLFVEIRTHYLLRKKAYADALPYLQKTIDNERNTYQKKRLQFLLGQIYALQGENAAAFRAFEAVKGLNTPHELALNATTAQAAATSGSQRQNIVRELEKMSRNSKNANYLDKIYFAVGNAYLRQNDTVRAIENFLKAEKTETALGLEKTLAQVALGDIFFHRKDFVKAEPRYADALPVLPPANENYPRVAFRADVLKEFVPHAQAVAEQDSLQHLAKLPHEEQLLIIRAKIAALRRSERSSERDAYLAQQQMQTQPLASAERPAAESAVALATRTGETAFYFYNSQLVSQGKTEFKRLWGNRRLEDNWRRADASRNQIPSNETNSETASQPTDNQNTKSANPLEPEFYLQQLPTTPAALQASNLIIENGLFAMANIATSRLQDFDYAIGVYNRILADFPQSTHTPDIYYQLYLIHLRLENNATAQTFKQRLLHEFPDNERATAARRPDFDQTARNYAQTQESLYQKAYSDYRNGHARAVQSAFDEFREQFPDSDLMPKFLLLNALSYAQTGDAENTQIHLDELLSNYPESDAAPLAQSISDGLTEGKTLAQNASVVSNAQWQPQTPSVIPANVATFSANTDTTHVYLAVYDRSKTDRNALLFAVANFNFSQFQLRTFGLSSTSVSSLDALQVGTFRSFDEASRYARMIADDTQFKESVPAGITAFVISVQNMDVLNHGKTTDDYLQFYADSLNGTWMMREEIPSVEKIDAPALPEPEKIVPLKTETRIETPPVRQETHQTPQERQAELERREAEALRQQQKTAPQKSREQLRREREKERREKIRQRERELKERQRQREQRLRERRR